MPKPLLVTAAIIRHQGKILIAKRKLDAKFEPNRWEFPGGKVEFTEHPEACVVREIKEELNIDIQIEKFFALNSHVYQEELHVVLLAYLCTFKGGDLKVIDAAEAKWVEAKTLKDYEWATADIPFVDALTRA
jgi:8-oxo-dGTP diphosphatase